jgi:hypothetical protein
MNSYYTNIEVKEGKYIGRVFNASNNAEIYITKEYTTQQQVVEDMNAYLSAQNQVVAEQVFADVNQHRQAIIKANRYPAKRCCGR